MSCIDTIQKQKALIEELANELDYYCPLGHYDCEYEYPHKAETYAEHKGGPYDTYVFTERTSDWAYAFTSSADVQMIPKRTEGGCR